MPEEILKYLDERRQPFLTADDVAKRFDCSGQTARNKLGMLIKERALNSVSLGPGKPQLYFRPDYEAATQAINVLREHLDIESIDRDHLAAFANEPYCILPKAENEAWVICPRFIPFHVGWLDRQTKAYNVFIVNKYVDWIDELPDDIRQQVGISAKYEAPTAADGELEIPPEERAEAWDELRKSAGIPLSRAMNGSQTSTIGNFSDLPRRMTSAQTNLLTTSKSTSRLCATMIRCRSTLSGSLT